MAALDKIFELLDEEPDVRDTPDAFQLPPAARRAGSSTRAPSPMRRTRRSPALRDIDLHVPAGPDRRARRLDRRREVDVRQAGGALLRPDGGPHPGRRPRPARREAARCARRWASCPQEAYLFSGTIRENLAFGRPGASDESVEAAARAVGSTSSSWRSTDGYDTDVGERGVQLSAGQRQLVAFARALVADPRILVLDEATSNVDIHTEGQIEQGLRRLLAGRTAIVIAHRLSTIQRAGRIIVLDDGRIAEQGTHEELLEARGATGSSTATGRSRPPRRDPASRPLPGRPGRPDRGGQVALGGAWFAPDQVVSSDALRAVVGPASATSARAATRSRCST